MRSALLVSLVLFAARAVAQPPPAEPVPVRPDALPPEPVPVDPGPDILPDNPPPPPGEPVEAFTGPLGPRWSNLEFLLWWVKAGSAPPLVTANAFGRTPLPGEPGALVAFGGGRLDQALQAGTRLTFGWSLGPAQTSGYEVSFFGLGETSREFALQSTGLPHTAAIGRPFFDPLTLRPEVLPVATPGTQGGGVRVTATTSASGIELSAVHNLVCFDLTRSGPAGVTRDVFHLTALAGARYFGLRDELRVEQLSTVFLTSPGPWPALWATADQFNADTDFYGGQVGLQADWRHGPVSLELAGKLALGAAAERVTVAGTTIVAGGGMFPLIQDGGLLAVGSNSGRHSRSAFAVLPEATARLGYQLGEHARVFVGYNFLYLSDAVRAGDQVDRVVNPALAPLLATSVPVDGPERPRFAFRRSDFWAQGVLIGLEGRY
jgi:hypothetical protein